MLTARFDVREPAKVETRIRTAWLEFVRQVNGTARIFDHKPELLMGSPHRDWVTEKYPEARIIHPALNRREDEGIRVVADTTHAAAVFTDAALELGHHFTGMEQFAVTDEMISDIGTAAFEGGSNHWVAQVRILDCPPEARYTSEAVAYGGALAVAEWADNPNERPWHPLDRTTMVRGICLAAQAMHRTPQAFHEQHDANDADNAVQFALFGRLTYC